MKRKQGKEKKLKDYGIPTIFLVAPFSGRLMIMVATPGCLRHVLESRRHSARDGVKQQEALTVLVGGEVGLGLSCELRQSVDICCG